MMPTDDATREARACPLRGKPVAAAAEEHRMKPELRAPAEDEGEDEARVSALSTLSTFPQSEHVPLLNFIQRHETVLYLLLYGDWDPDHTAPLHQPQRRLGARPACCTLRMPPGWPHPRFCAYRMLSSRPQP